MLSSVHQLTDALAALRVTMDLPQQQQQQKQRYQLPLPLLLQQQQQQQLLAASQLSSTMPVLSTAAVTAAATAAADLQAAAPPLHSGDLLRWFLFEQGGELASLLEGEIGGVVQALADLVGQVQLVVRHPTAGNKQQLQDKVRPSRWQLTQPRVLLRLSGLTHGVP